jgi:YD repeat-containing protein
MVGLTCLVHWLAHRSSLRASGERHKQAATKSLIRAVSMLTVLGVLLTADGALGDITYVYDPGGRLVAVTDASGNRADYIYDPGNLLIQITNSSSSQTAVYSISPDGGVTGTQVTITGTGFSSTPSQNTVTFSANKAASVLSSTSTTIVATVPSSAVGGAVSVSTPSGVGTGYFEVYP